ncbi:MAG TPA: hybrid sensor histidine kinase/response regulator [Gammaproteobacteria bacterium]|nr:hybrid sensor histidine kinase/response regulator [Gammaproteobacteria bacterium]
MARPSSPSETAVAPPVSPELLLRGRLGLLRAQLPVVLAGNLLVSSIAAWMLRERVAHELLLLWVAGIWVVALARWLLDARLVRLPTASAARWRLAAFALGSAVSGVLWGSSVLWLADIHDPLYTAMVVLMLAGMTAGAVPSLSAHALVYACYAVPALAPLAVVLLAGGEGTIPAAGIFMALFLLVNLGYSLVLHRRYGETIRRRHENALLVERLREQMRIAQEADLAKTRFLAAASHDLRQPLYAMGLFLDTLEQTLDDPRQRHLMQRVRQSADALQDLFNALLDISRLDAGAMQVERQPLALEALLRELQAEFAPQAQAKGLHLEVAPCQEWVESDPLLLGRMLRNLLSNAIRYTESGSVLVSGERHDGRLRLSVCDTGPGIAEADRQRIFREFQQLDNPGRDRRQGLGLGLAIVRRLANLLDHPLELRSRLGEGSCFLMSLPLARPLEGEGYREPDSVHREWCGEVLVVDDETEVLEALTEVLLGWGMQVQVAEDIDEARALVEAGLRPELLISDYRLRSGPVGLELIRWARSRLGEGLGVLLVTGDTAAEELARMHAQGVPVLNKPVRAADLRRAIDREMERAARSAQASDHV